MAFAVPTDVAIAYEGSSLPASEQRVEYLLDTANSRLRILLPDLESRVEEAAPADPLQPNDLAILAKDVVVQAVLRRLPGDTAQQLRSQTQQAGPFQTTLTFTTDRSGIFPDEDLDLLRGQTATSSIGTFGTIKLGRVDWANQ